MGCGSLNTMHLEHLCRAAQAKEKAGQKMKGYQDSNIWYTPITTALHFSLSADSCQLTCQHSQVLRPLNNLQRLSLNKHVVSQSGTMFRMLKAFHILNVQAKTTAHDFWKSLAQLTNGSGLLEVPVCTTFPS